ncbi:MAG: hypothetical protein ACRESS_02420 [Stenotrophobium sp.]
MKRLLFAAILTAVAIPAFAQVGVSVNIGEPGFYGQINLGDAPPPQVIYSQPVIVAPAPEYGGVAPIYLRVPPGYQKHWRKHCAQYNACGRPVYFVRDDWYNNRYVPYYREHHGHRDEGDDRGDGDHGHGHGHGDHGDHGDHGHGHDHGD